MQQYAGCTGRPFETPIGLAEFEAGRRVKIDRISGSFPITVARGVRGEAEGCSGSAIVAGEASDFCS